MTRAGTGRLQEVSEGLAQPGHSPAVDAEPLVTALRALADPLRLSVLRLLEQDAFAVQELCRMLEVSQPALSHHLKLLAGAGLVATHRDGTSSFYRRALLDSGDDADAPVAALLATLDARALPEPIVKRRQAVLDARAERSRAFFRRNAARFHETRDLVAPPATYLAVLEALLDRLPRRRSVLEVGPGPGDFLPALARRFQRVSALESATTLLEEARNRCKAERLDNVELNTGELPDAATETETGGRLPGPFDAVVCTMVAHHTAAPGRLIASCAARLAPNGHLLVAELCPHTQEWVREACGDVWLGLAPEALDHWARAAGLTSGPRQYLALRNGFRIQVRAWARPDASEPILEAIHPQE